jgi:hypothetical protein
MVLVIGFLVLVVMWLWALFDCITTPQTDVNYLPKPVWLAVIVLLSWIGSLAWFWFGRARNGSRIEAWRTLQPTPRAARPARSARPSKAPMGPDDDPEFLNRL